MLGSAAARLKAWRGYLVFILVPWVKGLEVFFSNVKIILHMGSHFRLFVKGLYVRIWLPVCRWQEVTSEFKFQVKPSRYAGFAGVLYSQCYIS